MTLFKNKSLLSLLLALVMVVTMLPMTALAAEANDEPENAAQTEHICTDEACVHESAVYEIQPDTAPVTCTDEACSHEHEHEGAEQVEDTHAHAEDVPSEVEEVTEAPVKEPEEEPAPETPEVSDNSPFSWELDADGTLYISGSGYVEPFYSPDDQPWRDVREQITSVRFNLSSPLEVYDLCYWFDGCINLNIAAIPVYVCQIAPSDFYGCPSLSGLTYGGVDVLAEITADYSNQTGMELMAAASTAGGGISLFSASNCGVSNCTCTGPCYWGYRNYRVAPESNNYHIMTVYCETCGRTSGIIVSGNHSFMSNGYCSLCGYYNSAYDTTICYHTSTSTTWVTGCRWEKYCTSCGAYVSSGVTHGPYTYGNWQYYTASQHRRSYTCSYGDSGTYYETESHSATTSYGQHSATQHSVSSYCSTCASTIGSTSYANHSFTYGSWASYSSTQHRRLKTCSGCGYSEYEYADHALSYGSWASYSDTQHRSMASCATCGYSGYEYAAHAFSYGSWASVSDTQHSRAKTCSCGYSTTEYADHTLTYGGWTAYSDTQHQRTVSCSGCSFSTTETGEHADANGDGYCDDCGYEMTRFSVTVPVSLTLTISKQGVVYAAGNAAIVNNSTGAVEITGLTVSTANGWTLVPYSTNMAAEKVDAKLIGFALNGAQSANIGTSEALALTGAWSIPSGDSLALDYHAAVSATSAAISEQVLTVIFVLEWA